MPEQKSQNDHIRNWEECYQKGSEALPWDTGEVAPELKEYFEKLSSKPKNVLEVGCGTGTNALFMAAHGSQVTATDISATAIKLAQEKANSAGKNVDFKVADILESLPVEAGSVNFVFDRGVYHVMPAESRKLFIERVANALTDDGFWLCIAGSADEQRGQGEEGPPQLKASELVILAEEKFEIFSLQRVTTVGPFKVKPIVMWQVLYKKR